MGTKFIQTKATIFFLAMILLLQSCGVYNVKQVTLPEAAAANKKVKVVTANGKRLKFYRVQQIDSAYYGVHKSPKKTKVLLIESEVRSIRFYNKQASIICSVVLGALTIGMIVIVGAISSNAHHFNFYDNQN